MWMIRPLIVPICFIVSAWSFPTGPQKETPAENLLYFTVVEKTAQEVSTMKAFQPASLEVRAPAETTEQAIDAGEQSVEQATTSPEAESEPEETVVERIPLPPRRPVPHREVCEALATAAAKNDLPTPFFIRLIWQESGFRQNVVSPAGAQGVAQFMPQTAAQFGLDDPFNPLQAVRASAQLLRGLFHQFGNLGLAAAAYNAGPKRVQDWLDKRGKLPQETRDYVQRITGTPAEQWKGRQSATQIRVPAMAPCQREAGLFAANGPARIPLPPVLSSATTVASAKPAMRLASADRTVEVAAPRIDAAPAKKSKHGTTGKLKTMVITLAKEKPPAGKKAAHTTKVAKAESTGKSTKHGAKAASGKKVRVATAERGKK